MAEIRLRKRSFVLRSAGRPARLGRTPVPVDDRAGPRRSVKPARRGWTLPSGAAVVRLMLGDDLDQVAERTGLDVETVCQLAERIAVEAWSA